MSLNPENERRLRRNWSLLKQELDVEQCIQRFVERGVFPPQYRNDILNVIPNTQSMKGNYFYPEWSPCNTPLKNVAFVNIVGKRENTCHQHILLSSLTLYFNLSKTHLNCCQEIPSVWTQMSLRLKTYLMVQSQCNIISR